MLRTSTIKLLRIPFSFFLSPIYFFSLAQVPHIDWANAVLIFFILHFLIYPASNGYNSYMDRDTESIGGLENHHHLLPNFLESLLFWIAQAFY
jgi:1,4-dihydroxy-2-naphthoate octaprenyltransferase